MGYVTFGEPLGFTRDPCPRTRKLLKCVDDDFDYFAAVRTKILSTTDII